MSAPENPKLIRAQKEGKAPLEYLVYSVLEGDAHVHKGGADKYGVRNWLKDHIRASTYEGAVLRHLKAWAEGEDIDPESGWSHLYHIRSCCAILLDSAMRGTLIDDRNRCESINDKQELSNEEICAQMQGYAENTTQMHSRDYIGNREFEEGTLENDWSEVCKGVDAADPRCMTATQAQAAQSSAPLTDRLIERFRAYTNAAGCRPRAMHIDRKTHDRLLQELESLRGPRLVGAVEYAIDYARNQLTEFNGARVRIVADDAGFPPLTSYFTF